MADRVQVGAHGGLGGEGGCVAQLAMDEALINKLKAGKTATLGVFQTPEEGVGVQAPLAGFKEAYEQLP